MELRGAEDAVAAVGSDGEGLRVVLEGVGRRLGAAVGYAECLALFQESEAGVGAERSMEPGATLPATRRWRT